MSPALEYLLNELDNPDQLSWKDETYDFLTGQSLSSDDRVTYVERLIAKAQQGDTRAMLTLAYIDAKEALPTLRALAHSDVPWSEMARRALVVLGCGAEIVQERAHDAVDSHRTGRVLAVMDLPKVGGPVAIAALEQVLTDPEYAVRQKAWNGLVEVFGLLPHIANAKGERDFSSEIEVLRILLGSDLPPFVTLGATAMRALTAGLRSGKSPAALGIVRMHEPEAEVFNALRAALFEPTVPFPLDEIAKLTGLQRRFAETMIAMRLEAQDPRVAVALAQLGATWLAPALAEIANWRGFPLELRTQLADSARLLGTS